MGSWGLSTAAIICYHPKVCVCELEAASEAKSQTRHSHLGCVQLSHTPPTLLSHFERNNRLPGAWTCNSMPPQPCHKRWICSWQLHLKRNELWLPTGESLLEKLWHGLRLIRVTSAPVCMLQPETRRAPLAGGRGWRDTCSCSWTVSTGLQREHAKPWLGAGTVTSDQMTHTSVHRWHTYRRE